MLNFKEYIMWAILMLAVIGISYQQGYSDSSEAHLKKTTQAEIALVKQEEVHRAKLQENQLALEDEWRKKSQMVASSASVLVDDLRNRNVRLSVKLADLTVASVQDSNQCRADGRAELHRETSEFLIGEAQRADAQVKALQGTVKNLQQGGVQ